MYFNLFATITPLIKHPSVLFPYITIKIIISFKYLDIILSLYHLLAKNSQEQSKLNAILAEELLKP